MTDPAEVTDARKVTAPELERASSVGARLSAALGLAGIPAVVAHNGATVAVHMEGTEADRLTALLHKLGPLE